MRSGGGRNRPNLTDVLPHPLENSSDLQQPQEHPLGKVWCMGIVQSTPVHLVATPLLTTCLMRTRFSSAQTVRPKTAPQIYGPHILKSFFFCLWTFSCITVHRHCAMQEHETVSKQNRKFTGRDIRISYLLSFKVWYVTSW